MQDAIRQYVVNLPSLTLVVVVTLVVSSTTAAAQSPNGGSAPATDATTQSSARGIFKEPEPLRKGLEMGARRMGGDDSGAGRAKSGFYPEMGNMVTGAGWISAGVGYRHWMFGNRAFVDASTGLSWRAYKMAQARFEVLPFADERLSLGTQVRWQDLTQVNYWGDGPDTTEDTRSEYRLKSVDTVGYAVARPISWLQLHGKLGWLSSPNLLPPAGAFGRDNPHARDVFPDNPVYQFDEQPDFLHSEASVVVERRDEPGYPTQGGVYRAGISRYSDRELNRFTFNRFEAEAAHFVPFGAERNIVFAVRGWVVGTTTGAGQHVPFYLMPSLGGNNTLRGYHDYRFHDRNVALLNTELRVALMEHIDVVGLFEAGNVAARFADLDLDKKSYGVGIRVHTRTATFARLDLARSDEGWKIVFRMNDPLRLSSRHNKRTAQAPFAP
jgi:hypothetical protein